jgi:hypothetical protein
MTTLVFYTVLFALSYGLFWHFKPKLMQAAEPKFRRMVPSGRDEESKIRFIVRTHFLVDKRSLAAKLRTMINGQDAQQAPRPTQMPAFMLLAVDEKVATTVGLPEGIAVFSKIIGWVFFLYMLNMFRQFIVAGITEAWYRFIVNADSDKLSQLIRSFTIGSRSKLELDLRNTLVAYQQIKKSEEEKSEEEKSEEEEQQEGGRTGQGGRRG